MSEYFYEIEAPPFDVSLLLRTHAELRCLHREVMPVLRQLETGEDLPEEQYGAAMAYLEVSWLEARRHARETDCAHEELCGQHEANPRSPDHDERLYSGACRYYEAVKMLRAAVKLRVSSALNGCEHEPMCLQQAARGLSI